MKWGNLRQALQSQRIRHEGKTHSEIGLLRQLPVHELCLRWQLILPPKQDPALELHLLPSQRGAKNNSVKQWGWRDKGQMRRFDDGEIDTVSLLASTAPSVVSSSNAPAEKLSPATTEVRKTANAVAIAAKVSFDCAQLVPSMANNEYSCKWNHYPWPCCHVPARAQN